jgi:2-polyprenyl-3-methyl-5-hydroxy-6-metoxy-1,4-benzoquinol methylase
MIARLRAALSRQLSHPSGSGGKVVARLMNRGNRNLNDRAIARLDVRPGDRVLDLGFGGGLSFAPLWERGATVVAIDRADDMVASARAASRMPWRPVSWSSTPGTSQGCHWWTARSTA